MMQCRALNHQHAVGGDFRKTAFSQEDGTVILSSTKSPPVGMEEVTDPAELAEARAQHQRFERNWSWFQAHANEIYQPQRGKCICVAGGELFVAETPAKVLAMAKEAHPEDDGRFTLIITKTIEQR
jgi:hypothetical protein